jgi:hypothetical protein
MYKESLSIVQWGKARVILVLNEGLRHKDLLGSGDIFLPFSESALDGYK